jgi:transketolase
MNTADLLEKACSAKLRFLKMYREAHAGHVGCSLSCAEMLVFVRFAWMQRDDTLILSKGHAAAGLYAVLAEAGSLSQKDLETFARDGTTLPAHPPINALPDIPFATGSLGHGLSLAAGMALATRLKGRPRRFFCITSDGELNEGSVWEAALFVAHQELDNLIWLIDRNGLQGIGRTEDVMALEPLIEKLQSFGWFVSVADGHDFDSLRAAMERSDGSDNRSRLPSVIICKTVKGHGLPGLQDTVDCHYLPLNDGQYEEIVGNLAAELRVLRERGSHES